MEQKKSSKWLVRSSGFVGRHVSEALGAAGFEVTCAGRHRPGAAAGVAGGAAAATAVRWRSHDDIGPGTAWDRVLDGMDVVIHLAALAHLPDSVAATARNREAFHSVNVEGTRRLAEQAARAGVRRLVFMSSVGIHGQTSGRRAFRETDTPDPQSDYTRSKLAAESALADVGHRNRLSWVALRPPMVIGPGAPGNLARLCGLVGRGLPLPLGAATAPKSFIGIANLASAVVAAVATTEPAALNRAFLVADAEVASTAVLVREIGAALGRPARLVPVPAGLVRAALGAVGRGKDVERLFDPLVIDTTAIRESLGWRPPLTFAEGVRRAVAGPNTSLDGR